MRAAIVGIAGPRLLDAERALFRAHPPAGAILFARNIEGPDQLRALTADLRATLPPGAVLMVDQEGGRVARLRPPHWRVHPPARTIGLLHEADPPAGQRAAWLTGALIGLDCRDAGFDVACAPVLDVQHPGAHDIVGDRSFGPDPEAVAVLGRAVAHGLMAAGVQPVCKHAPGHGRARADSHLELPVVPDADISDDIEPFRLNADLPWFMTAHLLYAALDPVRPGTLSPAILQGVIREEIGFAGMLVTDDLAMRALAGEPADLGAEALAAGCDVAVSCSGEFAPTEALLASVPALGPAGGARLAAARTMAGDRRIALDGAALAAERERLLG